MRRACKRCDPRHEGDHFFASYEPLVWMYRHAAPITTAFRGKWGQLQLDHK